MSFARRRESVGKDIESELQFHLEMRMRELSASGLPEDQARKLAEQQFGDLDATRKYCKRVQRRFRRKQRWRGNMSRLGQDVEFAWRQLMRNKAFSLLAVATLAIGLGSNAAIFSVLDTVVLQPLPVRDPHRLVFLWTFNLRSGPEESSTLMSFPDYSDFEQGMTSLEGLAAWKVRRLAISSDSGEPASSAEVTLATHNLLPLMGVTPHLGRVISQEDDREGASRVAVLGYQFWQSRMGGSENALGRSLLVDGELYTVVGVLPRSLQGQLGATGRIPPAAAAVWLPLRNSPGSEGITLRSLHNVHVVGRLAKGSSLRQANEEAAALASSLAREHSGNRNEGVWLEPLHESLVRPFRPALWILFGSVGLVLLISCSNVANLLIGRLERRAREVSIRRALGATSGRIMGLLLTESLLLSLLGGVAGAGLAWFGIRMIRVLSPEGIPRLELLALDIRSLSFLLAASLFSGIFIGALPALRAASNAALSRLRSHGTASRNSRRSTRVRSGLVVLEVGLACLLVIAAGLSIRSFHRVLQVDMGFDPENVLVARLNLPGPFVSPQWPHALQFYESAVREVSGLPGVRTASVAHQHPLQEGWSNAFEIEGMPRSEPGRRRTAILRPVTSDYFRTTGIQLLQGRCFSDSDASEGPGAAIVNRALVEAYFGDREPLGRHLVMRDFWNLRSPLHRIVGVVDDVRFAGFELPAPPAVYFPYAQWPFPRASLVIKTEVEPLTLAASVRAAIARLDSRIPVEEFISLDYGVDESLRDRRFVLSLLGTFAVAALVLSAVGIYGVISAQVAERTSEIGLRMALGADRRNILRTVVGRALVLSAFGLAFGLAAAFASSHLLAEVLYEVSPTDPATYGSVAFFLGLTAAVAALQPALRAARTDPIRALASD